jgi:hypothetical protein
MRAEVRGQRRSSTPKAAMLIEAIESGTSAEQAIAAVGIDRTQAARRIARGLKNARAVGADFAPWFRD